MPTLKPHFRLNPPRWWEIVGGAAWLPLLVLGMSFEQTPWGPPLFGLFLLSAVAAVLLLRRFTRQTRTCPQCGGPVVAKGYQGPGRTYHTLCEPCDVLWDTGLTEHTGDGGN